MLVMVHLYVACELGGLLVLAEAMCSLPQGT